MNCVNQYLDKCTNASVRTLIEREINGARRFFQHLCGSKKFQENYLHHSSCIRTTRPDWNECIRRYRTIIHHEINAPATATSAQEEHSTITRSLHYCWWVGTWIGCAIATKWSWVMSLSTPNHRLPRFLRSIAFHLVIRLYIGNWRFAKYQRQISRCLPWFL